MKVAKLRRLAVLAIIGAFGLAVNANALVILQYNDALYIGNVFNGTPASEAHEAGYINGLIGLAAGAELTSGGQQYTRSDNVFTSLPEAAANPHEYAYSSNVGDFGTGWTYLLGFYSAQEGSHVWDVRGLTGAFQMPATLPDPNRFEVSHWRLFNPVTSNVPDGGAAVLMLGVAVLALGGMKRFLG